MRFSHVIKCAITTAFWILYFAFVTQCKTVDLSFRNLNKEDFFLELQMKINIHEVTHLKLAGNQFDNFIDCSTDLQSLEYLDLSQNKLENFFFLCKSEYNLKVLNISNNHVKYIDDKALNQRISKLKILDMSNNRIVGINDTMLEHMKVLEFLSLADNPIGDNFDEYAFWDLSHLKTLNLRNVSTTFFSPVLFQLLQNLTSLDLSMNPIEVIPILPPMIEVLDLSSTNLLHLGNLMLPKLRILQVNNMPNLTTALLNYFENLTNLETLSMAGCAKLTKLKVWPPNPRLLPQLQHLSIQNCALQTLSIELRPIFQRTPILDLQNNPWKCDCHFKWIHMLNLTNDPNHGIKCLFPSQLHDKLLSQVSENDLQCKEPNSIVYTILWSCFSILLVACAIVGLNYLFRNSMGKWTMIRKGKSRDTVSYANVVESSNDLVKILSDGDALHRNDE